MGDHIIEAGVKKQLEPIIKDDFIVEISTHLPVSRQYMKYIQNFEKKFVGGSNLLRGKMNRSFRQWDINLLQADLLKNSILVGVGWWQYGDELNNYTKKLYKNILSTDYLHSVRDNYTKEQLNSIGFNNVINTSCATMWDLTEEHCHQIPIEKQKSVIFTLTDYNKNQKRDRQFVNILVNNYDKVFMWVQGERDLEYLKELNIDINKINIVPPSLKEFDKVLQNLDIDYIGTRLHGGVRALQHQKRTIIIGIDNRALEKKKDFNIDVVDREDMDLLENVIYDNFKTEIVIPEENIKEWKKQFIN